MYTVAESALTRLIDGLIQPVADIGTGRECVTAAKTIGLIAMTFGTHRVGRCAQKMRMRYVMRVVTARAMDRVTFIANRMVQRQSAGRLAAFADRVAGGAPLIE